jgi:acyl-CoA thioester hydrolase
MPEFEVVHRDRVRARDVDPRDHVNNAVFSVYAAEAVLAWYAHRNEPGAQPSELVLVRTEIDFRSPIVLGESIEVAVRVESADPERCCFAFEIRADGRLAAEGRRVLAGRGDGQRLGPVPGDWRPVLDAELAGGHQAGASA